MVPRGRLVVVEGPDGVGKTTLARALAERLTAGGAVARYVAFPGTNPQTLGGYVYELHHNVGTGGLERLDPTSLQLLHIAAHIDAIETQILPALSGGETIVLDRFWWSTWAYGMVSGADARSLDLMLAIEQHHWRDVLPDVIFLVLRRALDPYPSRDSLVTRYKDLASSTGIPVHVLTNDGTVAEALDLALKCLSETSQSESDDE